MSCPSSCGRPRGAASSSARQGRSCGASRREELPGGPPRSRSRAEPELEFDEERIVARTQGREGWLREARRQLEQHRWQHPDPVPRSRAERLLLAAERLEVELADGAPWRMRRTSSSRSGAALPAGIRVGGPPKPYQPPQVPDGKVNLTDPDSKRLKAREGYVQGYNAQAVVDEGQIVLAAEITNSNTDWSQLDPMVTATHRRARAGGDRRPARDRARRRAVLERRAHGRGDRQQAHPGADPTRRLAAAASNEPAGPAVATAGCDTCSPQHSASSCTENACRRSSRCSVTPATTEASHDSSEEAAPPCAPSGDY